jgi:hypothetical protein
LAKTSSSTTETESSPTPEPCALCQLLTGFINPVIQAQAPDPTRLILVNESGPHVKFGEGADWAPFCEGCSKIVMTWLGMKTAEQMKREDIVVGQKTILLPGPGEYRG